MIYKFCICPQCGQEWVPQPQRAEQPIYKQISICPECHSDNLDEAEWDFIHWWHSVKEGTK